MGIKTYFPKKKLTVLLAGFCAIAVIGGVFLLQKNSSFYRESPSDAQNNEAVVLSTETKIALKKDTDEDGLKDWEERLWGTDPKNADTDGDSTGDGKEIQMDRDPTIPGPDDQIKPVDMENGSTTAAAVQLSLSQSEVAARNFFARYLALKQAGALGPNSGARLTSEYVSEILQDFNEDGVLFETYTVNDISVRADSGSNALREYGNKMGAIILKYPSVMGSKTELQIFLEALASGKAEDFEKIAPYITRYENIINESLAVVVPKSAVQMHLGYINALRALKRNAAAMRNSQIKPLSSGIVIRKYVETQEPQVIAHLRNIDRFFIENGVSFSITEPGSAFSGA